MGHPVLFCHNIHHAESGMVTILGSSGPEVTSKRYLSHEQVAALALEVGGISDGRKHGYHLVILTLDYEHRSIPIPAFLRRLASQIAGHGPEEPVFYGIRARSWLRNHVFRVGWFDPAQFSLTITSTT